MTTHEAAEQLALSVKTIQAHIKSGQLKAKKIGRDWHISDEEVERFRQEKRPAHRPKKHETP